MAHTRVMPVGRARARTVLVVTWLVVVFPVSACTPGDVAGPTTRSSNSAGAHENPTAPTTPVSPPATPHPVTAGANRHLAMAAAAHAIRHFPVPPGATRIDAPPAEARYLRRLHTFVHPVDSSLTRTRWWLVPRRYDRLVGWYVAHTPAHRGSTLVPGTSKPSPEASMAWRTQPGSKSYSPPAEVVAYTRLGPHLTAIRTDVTLAARADRTAKTLVPATVTRLEITRRPIYGSENSPAAVTVTDRSRIFAVIAAFNRARGEYASVEPHPCGSPAGGRVHHYAVAFHWPGHTLVVDTGQPLCQIGRRLTLDGAHLPQTLTDSRKLDGALRAAFDDP